MISYGIKYAQNEPTNPENRSSDMVKNTGSFAKPGTGKLKRTEVDKDTDR